MSYRRAISVLRLRPLTLSDYHLKKWTKVKSTAPIRRTLGGKSALDANQLDIVALSLYGGNAKRETLVNCFRRSSGDINCNWQSQCDDGQRALSCITRHDMCLDDPDGADVDFLLLYLNSCLAFDFQPSEEILTAVVASQPYLLCSSAAWERCVAALLQLADLRNSDVALKTATMLLDHSSPGIIEQLQPTGVLMWLYAATCRFDADQPQECTQSFRDLCNQVIARCVKLLGTLQMSPTEVAEMIRLAVYVASSIFPQGSPDVLPLFTACLASTCVAGEKLRLPQLVAVWESLAMCMTLLQGSMKAEKLSDAMEAFDVLAHKTYVVADLVSPADAIRVLELIHKEPACSARYKKLPAALVEVVQAVDEDYWSSQPTVELEAIASSLDALVSSHAHLADVVRCVASIRLAKASVAL